MTWLSPKDSRGKVISTWNGVDGVRPGQNAFGAARIRLGRASIHAHDIERHDQPGQCERLFFILNAQESVLVCQVRSELPAMSMV
jgi:hypothetical protein